MMHRILSLRPLLLLAAVVLGTLQVQAQSRGLIVEPPTGQGSMDPVDLIRAENPLQEFEIVLGTVDGRTSATAGETVQFAVRSERSGYVTLLNQNPEGKVIFLYPNKWSPSKRIEAHETIYFPASEQDFRIRVAPPFGREYVKAIVTPEPLVDAAAASYWAVSPLLEVEGPPEGGGSDDLGGFDPSQWATASMHLNTAPEEPGGAPVPVPEAPTAHYGADPVGQWETVFAGLSGASGQSVSKQAASQPQEETPDEILVLYKPKVGTRAFGNSIGGGGLFNNIRVVEADRNSRNVAGTRSLGEYGDSVAEQVAGLNADPDVLVAVPNYKLHLFDAVRKVMLEAPEPAAADATRRAAPRYWDVQWGLHNGFYRSSSDRVDMRWRDALRSYRTSEEPIIVAVVDSGIHLDHPNVAPVLWKNEHEVPNNGVDDDGNGKVDDFHGWDAYAQDGDPTDPRAEDSHGNFVASEIAVRADSPDFFGLAPNVRILPVRVLGASGSGNLDGIVRGIEYAARNGARVINLSLGMTLPSADPEVDVLFQEVFAMAEQMGALVVIAAGNEAADSRYSYTYPARARRANTLTVAAMDISGRRAGFSNHGPHVDLGAPGQQIVGHPAEDRRVMGWDGTSMAAPYVSAAAALIWSQHPGWTPAQVKARILETVRPASDLDVESGGMIDIEAAVSR